ncbi:hypothetical protein D3C87_1501600 [compost metagenome]
MLGDFPGINPELDRCVVQPRAVQVKLQPMFAGKTARPGQVLQRQDFALHGVFQRQQAGAGKVEIVRFDRGGDLRQVQRAIGLHFQWLWLDRAEHGRAATFVLIGVRLLTDDVFVAAFAMGHQTQQIAHGAGRHKQGCGKTESVGQLRFQMIDRRILTINVIPRGGGGHCVEHAGGRLGDGVAAKIDNAHESGLGKQGNIPFRKELLRSYR